MSEVPNLLDQLAAKQITQVESYRGYDSVRVRQRKKSPAGKWRFLETDYFVPDSHKVDLYFLQRWGSVEPLELEGLNEESAIFVITFYEILLVLESIEGRIDVSIISP